MITAIELCHPQSTALLSKRILKDIEHIRISCGTTKMPNVTYSEANDFSPTYATWNSGLFETSVIMTVWEHANELIGNNNVAILHSDITPHFKAKEIWSNIEKWLNEKPKRSIGLSVPSSYSGLWDDWTIPPQAKQIPKYDPMFLHHFDNNINVWEYIKKYDSDIYDWAMSTQPSLIYSHQFACTRETFDHLGNKLYNIAHRLKLIDIGFWMPHVFERLIALYLAQYGGEPILSTAFWHYSSSGIFGPGEHSLYGPRPLKYYKISSRWNKINAR